MPGVILLSGQSDMGPVTHQDWTADPFQMTEWGKKLFGRGICEMKGFITAARAFTEPLDIALLTHPLHFSLI